MIGGKKWKKESKTGIFKLMAKKVEISQRTIIFTVLFLLFTWFLFLIRSIILGLFISLLLMSALNPLVRKLERLVPRWLAILVLYLVVLAVLILGIGGIIPPLIDQTSNLITNLPGFFLRFKVLGIDERLVASQISQFASIPTNIIRFLVDLFSNLVAILGFAIITFYLLLERKNIDNYLAALFGKEKEKEIERVIDKIEIHLGGWIRGELVLMTFVGILSYVGYTVIGLNFALPLAIIAFLLEIVPNIGPTLAAFPAILIGLTVSPVQALAVAGWAFLIQQLENSVLVPRVMKQAANVNPLISILALAVGLKLAGVGGAVLAIPAFIVLRVVVTEVLKARKPDSV